MQLRSLNLNHSLCDPSEGKMPDKKNLISKKDEGDEKSDINYCTLCKAAQIPDCGDRTKDNSGWNNAVWGVYASVRIISMNLLKK